MASAALLECRPVVPAVRIGRKVARVLLTGEHENGGTGRVLVGRSSPRDFGGSPTPLTCRISCSATSGRPRPLFSGRYVLDGLDLFGQEACHDLNTGHLNFEPPGTSDPRRSRPAARPAACFDKVGESTKHGWTMRAPQRQASADSKGQAMVKGFRDFILRGNVIELAIAFVMAGAFGAVVAATVAVIMDLIGKVGGMPNFSGFAPGGIHIGTWLTAVITFVVLALVIYFAIVVPYQTAMERFDVKKDEEAAGPLSEDTQLLTEIRDLLAERRTS
jgi:large conductance mechanosensitive channel